MPGKRRDMMIMSIIATLITVVGMWTHVSGTAPQTCSGIEQAMTRPFLAYEIRDDTPVVVFQMYECGEYVFIDRLQLDRMSMGVPFPPGWQWTGVWSSFESSSDPESIAFDRGLWETALFGQVNDPAIVAVEVLAGSETTVDPVSMPGILIELNDDDAEPDAFRFLNTHGAVIWTSTGNVAGR